MKENGEIHSSIVVHMDTDEEWGPRMKDPKQINSPINIELDPEVGEADEWEEALSSWKKQKADLNHEPGDEKADDTTLDSDDDWGD